MKKFLISVVLFFFMGFAPLLAGNDWSLVLSLKGLWKFSIGDNKSWASVSYNDSNWETIRVPSKWEDEGFYGYDGYAWYRKSFNGQVLANKNGGYTLFLGYIDDVDEVFLNGHKIGHSGSFPPKYFTAYNALRQYFIPNEFINFNGENVIAVRVFDAGIEGGIISGDVGIFTDKNDMGLAINLKGLWDFRPIGKTYPDSPPTDTDGWQQMMVPGKWEHQGYNNYDGNAWYQKKVFIPADMKGEELVLLLGKIDDFDDVYLNGELIGTTRISHDYRKATAYGRLRNYFIKPEQFKAGQWNTISVFVEDMYGFGGIYEGPVGLIKQSQFTRYMRWR